jgi:hypothetical protein
VSRRDDDDDDDDDGDDDDDEEVRQAVRVEENLREPITGGPNPILLVWQVDDPTGAAGACFTGSDGVIPF